METKNAVVNAVADLVVAAENNSAETAIVIDNVIDAANARVAAAENMASEIMAGAMESERGQRIANAEDEIWHGKMEVAELRQQLTDLSSQVADLTSAVSAMTVATIATQQGSSLLTPPISETPLTEAVQETLEILPGNLENVVEENPVPVPPVPKSKRRWM